MYTEARPRPSTPAGKVPREGAGGGGFQVERRADPGGAEAQEPSPPQGAPIAFLVNTFFTSARTKPSRTAVVQSSLHLGVGTWPAESKRAGATDLAQGFGPTGRVPTPNAQAPK